MRFTRKKYSGGGHSEHSGNPMEPVRIEITPLDSPVPGNTPRGCGGDVVGRVGEENQPRDVLTLEELEACARDIQHLVEESKYRTIADRMLLDLEREESARKRIPPGRMRIVE